MTDLPANVYRLPQRRFDAIPGAPWVYWVQDSIQNLFEKGARLATFASPRQGLATADNFRFLRFWWEVGKTLFGLDFAAPVAAKASHYRWFPCVKGGPPIRWYGNQEYVINYHNEGHELKAWADPLYGNSGWSRIIKSTDYYFREGVTWSLISAGKLSFRWMPNGWIITHKGPAVFCHQLESTLSVLGTLNSTLTNVLLATISPSIGFEVGHLGALPWIVTERSVISEVAKMAIRLAFNNAGHDEATFDFIDPFSWDTGIDEMASSQIRLADLDLQLNDEVYRLYGISGADRAAIEAELAGGALDHEDGEGDEDTKPEEREEEAAAGMMTREELAVRWISYAVGVVLGRFEVGGQRSEASGQRPIGRAVYHRDDFAIGSLPAPDEAEFDELVGPVERFAWVDADGGRHLFPAEAEQALRDLALPDGIAVLDQGHPRDLAALVERVLELMLGAPAMVEVVQAGAGGDLRKFLEKDFFTRWHLRWYRKRPVYWPLQSARRGYGFVLFHEKVEKYILYVLLRDYLDHKLNGLRLQIEDLVALAAGQAGAARRQTERQLERARQLQDEVNTFAQAIDRIAKGGYQPEATWIDDGVILRLAPLWELIPIWKAEPRKYWERLEQGDYDWSHIAMAYWPDRVRAACQVNKSFAIAHGHEEWFEGG